MQLLSSCRSAIAAMLLLALTGCNVTTVETADPAAVPDGPLEAEGGDATGPVVELGSGVSEGFGWRYAVYPSGSEWCTQLEMVAVTVSGCGDILPQDDRAFGSVGVADELAGGATPVEGIVTAETHTVWIVDENTGMRIPARLMPLEDAGLEGQAFVGFAPPDLTPTHVQAVKENGDVLETYELP
jgi:hypothetical protein